MKELRLEIEELEERIAPQVGGGNIDWEFGRLLVGESGGAHSADSFTDTNDGNPDELYATAVGKGGNHDAGIPGVQHFPLPARTVLAANFADGNLN